MVELSRVATRLLSRAGEVARPALRGPRARLGGGVVGEVVVVVQDWVQPLHAHVLVRVLVEAQLRQLLLKATKVG